MIIKSTVFVKLVQSLHSDCRLFLCLFHSESTPDQFVSKKGTAAAMHFSLICVVYCTLNSIPSFQIKEINGKYKRIAFAKLPKTRHVRFQCKNDRKKRRWNKYFCLLEFCHFVDGFCSLLSKEILEQDHFYRKCNVITSFFELDIFAFHL